MLKTGSIGVKLLTFDGASPHMIKSMIFSELDRGLGQAVKLVESDKEESDHLHQGHR